MDGISPKMQNQIAMLQQMQQQLQTVVGQKAQYEMAIREAKKAAEELADVPADAEVFMSVGTVMIQQSKEKVQTTLQERTESLELRVKSLEKQEKALQEKFESLSNQIKGALEGKRAPPTAE
jgi:prefoldin beta subunit